MNQHQRHCVVVLNTRPRQWIDGGYLMSPWGEDGRLHARCLVRSGRRRDSAGKCRTRWVSFLWSAVLVVDYNQSINQQLFSGLHVHQTEPAWKIRSQQNTVKYHDELQLKCKLQSVMHKVINDCRRFSNFFMPCELVAIRRTRLEGKLVSCIPIITC